ncbi:TasA family protein [Fervidibacillus halotolerans]|uniref:CalY family protein n=1 Tax=Fervidibacillus halotolerans TaxID=2980027 RepID=A0A9E8LYD7_9BACI|nr:TasA family protein [Fervidibacillus halotolerans]WAA11841.1 CalY family protein [Fervidibacillus halotolerans]
MSLKKKLGLGIISAALGISLVGGGTFAYFNDVETSNNTFAAGTLDLTVEPSVIFNVDNLKPGDYMKRYFELQNTGSLDIARVLLDTSYEVIDAKGDNGSEDMGEHFLVHFIRNLGHPEHWLDDDSYTVVSSKTIKELSEMTVEELAVELEDYFFWERKVDGIPAGESDYLVVMIEFVDNGEDQNIFQGDTLQLEWKFTAEQEEGERR